MKPPKNQRPTVRLHAAQPHGASIFASPVNVVPDSFGPRPFNTVFIVSKTPPAVIPVWSFGAN